MGFIYKITNPNGRLYVGKTYNTRKRINAHRCASKKERTGIILLNSIRKYGWENHKFDIIEEIADELMNEREMFWIAELKTYCYEYPGQMNMTKGAEGQRSTWMHDIERRKKASKSAKGEGNNFFGKRHTEKNKKLIGELTRARHLERGTRIPEWGAEKGRNVVRRPVVCYNMDGCFLSEYTSLTDAANKLKIAVESVKDSLKKDTWVRSKYFFRYKEGELKLKIDVPSVTNKTVKRPIFWLSEDLEVICEFASAQEASDFFGIPKTTINRAAQYNDLNTIRTGHIFCYKDEYLNEYKLVA